VVQANSKITSNGGGVSVTATGNTNANPAEALRLENNGAVTSGSNAAITITADSVNILANSGGINSGAGVTTIRTRTPGTQIDLGGADVLSGSPLVLGLTSAELDQITASKLVIGRNDIASGQVTVSADINRTLPINMDLISAGDIVISGGQVNIGPGTLLLDPGVSPAAVQPTHAGVDATAGSVSFGSDLAITIGGTTVDSEYSQLNVVGSVNLIGVDLVLGGSYVPATTDVFIIVSANGVNGQFNGLANGDTITFNGVDLAIQYFPAFVRLANQPLAVTLATFEAVQTAEGVVVLWETVSELHNLGFNLYRSQTAVQPETLLAFVPSQAPGSAGGFSYSYLDTTVQAGETYWYWLEDVDTYGVTTMHGPVSITVGAPTAVRLAQLDASSGPVTPASRLLALLTGLLALSAAGWTMRRRANAG